MRIFRYSLFVGSNIKDQAKSVVWPAFSFWQPTRRPSTKFTLIHVYSIQGKAVYQIYTKVFTEKAKKSGCRLQQRQENFSSPNTGLKIKRARECRIIFLNAFSKVHKGCGAQWGGVYSILVPQSAEYLLTTATHPAG